MGEDRGTRGSCNPSVVPTPVPPGRRVNSEDTGTLEVHLALAALHKGLILADRDKCLISSCQEQWLRDGCTHPSTQRPLLGLSLVEWGNVP